MYELARVRLFSVGPKGARYQNVTLDLRDVGAPVARPEREALFDLMAEEPGRAVPRRPSPATVLFLENGGGKSVLIKLIFSVMLPGRRQVVGARGTRVLDKFVLAQDVAHVALEWQHVRTGRRVVVGKVSAWRDHVVSTDPNRLNEAWYSFSPTASFGLDALPFTQDGRVVSMSGFRDRLGEAGKAEPHLQVVWETNHGEWRMRLTNLGLDPELFDYQRKMNAGEGEAADAFAFKSDEAFVDWLLTAVFDEDDLRSLGDVVEQYAAGLARRDGLMAERDFVQGALDRLEPLTEAARARREAESARDQARSAAETFGAAITVRHRQETERLAELTARERTAVDREQDAGRRAGRLGRIHAELRRELAGLRLKAATAELEDLRTRRDEARETLTAWRAAETLLAYRRAYDDAERVRRLVAEGESKAAPLLAERDEAARRLARGLSALATAAEDEAGRLDRTAGERAGQARQEEAALEDAIAQATRERGRAAEAEERVTAALADVRTAVEEGLLPGADADVGAAAEEARERAADAAERVAAALRDLSGMAGDRKRLGTEVRAAEQDRRKRQSAAQTAADALDRAETAARTLAGDRRAAELLGADAIDPETDAPVLLDLLDGAITEAEREQADLRMEAAADERVLDALGAGGLLPPAAHVTEALAVLEHEKITAWSGWRYLSTLPPQDREGVLAAHPHLVDGIVLNNPAHLERAEEVLTAARILPPGLVAVGTTADLGDPDAPPAAGVGFLVPPNPAMYDEERAEEERAAIADRQRERADRLAALTDRLHGDRDLRERLRQWQHAHPAGTLERLRTDKAEADEALATAETRLEALEGRIASIEQAEDEIQSGLPAWREEESAAAGAAGRLARLAETAARLPEWRETVQRARAAADAHDQAAEEHRRTAERLRAAAAEARREGDDQRRVATTARDELSRIPGAGTLDTSAPAPEEPVQVLRDAYESAARAYERAGIGHDLREDLTHAETRERETGAEVKNIDARVRDLAERLLAGPDGADASARAAATGRAERTITAREEEHEAQVGVHARLKEEYRRLPPQEITLEAPYERPTAIGKAEKLVARAEAEWDTARRAHEELRSGQERLAGQVESAGRTVERLAAYAYRLGELVPQEIDAGTAPFRGTMDEAETRLDDVMGKVRDTAQAADDAGRAVRNAADALAKYAADDRFAQVDSPVRRQIVGVERESLPKYAEEWEPALRPRLRSLTDELAQIDRHRSAIVDRLRGMVDQALAILRTSRRLSTLPDGLGEWSGQEFLRIRFETAEPHLLDEALGAVIDDATSADPARAKGAGRRDGRTLLLRGVRAAMPKGVRVDMLKPDAVLRTERVRVAEIGDVFSGGQLLTAAIILYCTMAALRANDRGHTRRQHAGVLFLDNPIGRASAGYLLELQIAVAEALGVQLVYTTGLFDTGALSVFPLIIRLRNDADLRAGLKYLSVDETIRRSLDGLPAPDETGEVTATRGFTRPPTPDAGRPGDAGVGESGAGAPDPIAAEDAR
ncbi:coiled-coil domain-containing protein [Actinoallomurus rhizosphaericola]|uniref:hypothetical protein n=1 Tax=Actinoallomurus rhizosphaericola TaxID=2952536 RepID=UPI002092AE3D|nr:hypothetical protein [Actinoallomurus rhizosphaericola]MCO5996241.1 hypothetical protein [Actinoallomurus rhizosphaericola]